MKKLMTLTLCLVCCFGNLFAQFQANNFEINNNLDIQIDAMSADTIWQISPPQKTLFNDAISMPNVLVSDTLDHYPTNLNASFIVELDENSLLDFPYIQLEWFQKTDMEEGVDGGIIEASYDEGQTWSNVFDDPNYRPELVGAFQWDTLHNDQAGITGTADWGWMAICWGSFSGTPPGDISTIQIRFTLTSDSLDTNQEGWMFDNFGLVGDVIGSTANQNTIKSFPLFPNPTKQEIHLDLQGFSAGEANIQIYNTLGVVMYTENLFINGEIIHKLDIHPFDSGIYSVLIKTRDSVYKQRFMKMD